MLSFFFSAVSAVALVLTGSAAANDAWMFAIGSYATGMYCLFCALASAVNEANNERRP